MKKLRKLRDAKKFDTIKGYVYNAIEQYPDNNAFIIKEKKNVYKYITYKQLGEEIRNFGTSLIDLGLENKRIAIIGKNSYPWFLTYLAVFCGVGITVPLDKGLQENEIIMSINRSKADAIVFEKQYLDVIEKIKQDKNAPVKQFICMEELEEKEDIYNISDLIKKGEELIQNGDTRFENHKIDPNEMATIIFTSGTTSMSKAVMLSNNNIASNIYDMHMVETFCSTDVNMAFLPFHHTFGSTGLLVFLSAGATNVFCDGLRHIQENLREYKVTAFVCVPLLLEAMYKKIMAEVERQGKTKLIKIATKVSNFLLKFKIDIRRKLFKSVLEPLGGKLRFIVSGASAIDKKVAKGFNDFGILAVQGYGLTECSPVLVAENEENIRYGSIGKPMLNIDIKIEDKNEEGIGEIVAKGPNVMLGYYEMPEETDKVLKDGWFHTGDLGYIDKDGFIFITGRKKNVIVLKNGKNVYPEEIEQIVANLPYVAENMVYGKEKDDDLVVSLKIVYNKEYVKEKYPDITEEQLKEIIWKDIKEINKTLPTYKYIKNLIITDEPMIKTTTAKVKRFEEMKKM